MEAVETVPLVDGSVLPINRELINFWGSVTGVRICMTGGAARARYWGIFRTKKSAMHALNLLGPISYQKNTSVQYLVLANAATAPSNTTSRAVRRDVPIMFFDSFATLMWHAAAPAARTCFDQFKTQYLAMRSGACVVNVNPPAYTSRDEPPPTPAVTPQREPLPTLPLSPLRLGDAFATSFAAAPLFSAEAEAPIVAEPSFVSYVFSKSPDGPQQGSRTRENVLWAEVHAQQTRIKQLQDEVSRLTYLVNGLLERE